MRIYNYGIIAMNNYDMRSPELVIQSQNASATPALGESVRPPPLESSCRDCRRLSRVEPIYKSRLAGNQYDPWIIYFTSGNFSLEQCDARGKETWNSGRARVGQVKLRARARTGRPQTLHYPSSFPRGSHCTGEKFLR